MILVKWWKRFTDNDDLMGQCLKTFMQKGAILFGRDKNLTTRDRRSTVYFASSRYIPRLQIRPIDLEWIFKPVAH